MFVLTNKQSKHKKRKTKASAQPKVVKNDIAVSDSEIIESNVNTTPDTTPVPSDKGLALDDIKSVIDKDLEKATVVDLTELNSQFDESETFEITLTGKTKDTTIRKPKINPLPESKIIEVLSTIWEKNREALLKEGFNQKNASRLAGSTYEEFTPYLNVVIPDNYEPRNHRSKELKTKGSDDWKLIGVNREAINRRMKYLMAKGSLIIYTVSGKFHLVPTKCMVKNVKAYEGSLWHIRQIRNILYNTKQWIDGTTPYISFFKDSNPLGLEKQNFVKVLGFSNETLQSLWTSSGFDEQLMMKELGVIS